MRKNKWSQTCDINLILISLREDEKCSSAFKEEKQTEFSMNNFSHQYHKKINEKFDNTSIVIIEGAKKTEISFRF
jgi:hypothetical protein